MEILLGIFYLVIFLFIIKKMSFFTLNGISKNLVYSIFIIKVLAGTTLYYYYLKTAPLAGDIFKYFNDGKIMQSQFAESPSLFFDLFFDKGDPAVNESVYVRMTSWYRSGETLLASDNRMLVRFNAILHFISFGSYHVHNVIMCFLSFIGLIGLYKSFKSFTPQLKWIDLILITCLPSILFWSSGVLKEGLIFFALGIFLYSTTQNTFNWKKAALILISLLILLNLKLFILLSFLPAWLIYKYIAPKFKITLIPYLVLIGIGIIGVFGLSYISPNKNIISSISEKSINFRNVAIGGTWLKNDTSIVYLRHDQLDKIIEEKDQKYFARIAPNTKYIYWKDAAKRDTLIETNNSNNDLFKIIYQGEPAGSYIPSPIVENNFSSALAITPYALFNTIVRPLPKSKGIMIFISGVENMCFLILIVICIWFRKVKSEINFNLLWFCLLFVLINYWLIGSVTPILGAIIRYKVPMLPFIIIAILHILDKHKLEEKFNFIKKINL